jgi:hypothetical protein
MVASEHPIAPLAKRRTHWIVIVLAVAAGSIFLTTFLQLHNVRILVSWHGFLHTAIANRFPGPFKVPENPFFAGEPLPYYWFHHDIAKIIGQALHIHPIHAFQIITACGLIILWISAGAIGVHRFGSLKAGLLAGFLLLTGVNPLGPLIAVSKYVVQGNRLLSVAPPISSLDTVFVTEQESGDLMTHPLLSALYVTGDWRRGQNVTWYLDNSSRGVALSLIVPLLFVFMGKNVSWITALSIGAIAALMTAFSPLIGLAVVGSVLAGAVAVTLQNLFRSGADAIWPLPSTLKLAAAATLGAAAASPTYYHLFLVGGSAMSVLPLPETLVRALALALNVIVLLPMAFWAALRVTDRFRDHYRVLVIAACGLLCAVTLVSLPDDTEHNLANTAQCLLVVPAVALTVTRLPRFTDLFLVCLFLPMTTASIGSYLGRPSLPVAFEGAVMHRLPDDALEQLYRWTRASTSPNAVFINDPAMPAKMSGNVAELPAFTSRSVFVDHASYLTTPHKDFERRRDMATRLVEGHVMSEPDATYLAALHRTVYLLSYRAGEPALIDRLAKLYGAPVFRERFVAVFDLTELAQKLASQSNGPRAIGGAASRQPTVGLPVRHQLPERVRGAKVDGSVWPY